jgi:hypothetical protein
MKDPYRSPPQAELVVAAGPRATVLFAGAGLAGAGLIVGLELGAPIRWLAAPLVIAGVALVVFAQARRGSWVFTLEGKRLRVEHHRAAGRVRLGALEVSDGIRLSVDVPEGGGGVEPRLRLAAGGDAIELFPGTRYREVHAELVAFLLKADVPVDAAKELPRLLP